MQIAQHLMDSIGARLTNSPQMRQAEAWTQSQFRSWGLKNVRKDGFVFGRGWSITSSSVRMTAPRVMQLTAIPAAGAPPACGPGSTERRIKRQTFSVKLDAFLKSERALAWARMSYRDGKLLHGEGYQYRTGETAALPGIEIAAEDYRRLARLAKVGPAPTLEVSSNVQFDDSDPKAYNILAEIPGTDPKAGYVMAGAHLDSWVAGDGAADNGAGTCVVMEAARILSTLGIRPRRTIRFALWVGEEQGILGSMSYTEKYLATRAPATSAGPENGDRE